MRPAFIIAFLLCPFALFPPRAYNAMEFTKSAVRGGTIIRAAGVIQFGDAEKFSRIAPQATLDENGYRRIVLASPGGNVAEAMRIAAIIRANNFVTLADAECASACAMILYPAGQYFMLLDGGRLGFHACYNSNDSTEAPECTEKIAELAAKNGFPYGSIKVFAGLAGPADMYWVTNVLAYCYGMEHFIGDPAPVTIENLCPSVAIALTIGNFREENRPLGPSFDCSKAAKPIEHLLCRDPELMHLDALMGELYRMLRRRQDSANRPLLVDQRAWIAERDGKCPVNTEIAASGENGRDVARCISEMTMRRMDKLLVANGTPRRDLSSLIKLLKR